MPWRIRSRSWPRSPPPRAPPLREQCMLESDLALVTGASRGIGRAIALALGGAGATVVGTATTEEGGARITAAFGAAGIPGRGAVWIATDPASTEALVEGMGAQGGLPTILVNNAGIARDA